MLRNNLALSIALCAATAPATALADADDFRFVLKGRIDQHTTSNSCSGYDTHSEHDKVLAIISNENNLLESVESFDIGYCGVKMTGYVNNSQSYHYKNLFGKEQLHQQFASNDFAHIKGGAFSVEAYIDQMERHCKNNDDELSITIHTKDGNELHGKQKFEMPHYLNSPRFVAYFDDEGIHSKMLGETDQQVHITYSYAFGDSERIEVRKTLNGEDALKWKTQDLSALNTGHDGTLKYLAVIYDYNNEYHGEMQPNSPLENERGYGGENRIELFNSGHPLFGNVNPDGTCR